MKLSKLFRVSSPIVALIAFVQPTIPAQGFIVPGEATHSNFGLEACGWVTSDSDYAVVVSHEIFNKKACGKSLLVTTEDRKRWVRVKIVGSCAGCKRTSLDLTREAFTKLAPLNEGRIRIKWVPLRGD